MALLTLALPLRAEKPEFTVFSDAQNGLVPDDGKVTIYARLSSWKPLEKRYKLVADLTGWSGESRSEASETFDYRMGRIVKQLPLSLEEYGPAQVVVSLQEADSGEKVASSELTLIRLAPVPDLNAEQRLASPIGVNTHNEANWEVLARLGIHWARDYSWGWLGTGDKLPLSDNRTNFRRKLDRATKAGVIILPCVRDALRDEVKGFMEPAVVEAAYRRYGDTFPEIPYWELENEYEHQLRMKDLNTLEVWGPFIEAAHRGLASSASQGKIALNGTAGMLYGETLELLDSRYKNDFSVVNYHYYTGQAPPERAQANMNTGSNPELQLFSFLDHLRDINRLAKSRGKEAWFTEVGWDVTYGPAVGLENQARYLPRIYLLSLWAGTDKIFWYFDRDTPAQRKFASCGLFDLEDNLRPSAATMAALSANISTAKAIGRVDLGHPDIWCLLMEKTDGGYVVPVWSVAGVHVLPETFRAGKGFDLFGNATPGAPISPDVQYFHFNEVPRTWKQQALVYLESPVRQPAYAGSEIEVKLRYPGGQAPELSWKDLPEGLSAGAWDFRKDVALARLSLDTKLPEGEYDFVLSATGGDGWTKTWDITANLLPPLDIEPITFKNDEWVELSLSANEETQGQWAFAIIDGKGQVKPGRQQIGAEEAATLALLVDESHTAPLQVRASHSSGISQSFIVPPATIYIPRSEGKTDAVPSDGAYQKGLMTEDFFRYDGETHPLTAKLQWSPEGLHYLLRLSGAINQAQSVSHNFWEADSIEMMLNARPGENWGWESGTHQFYFVPVEEDGAWSLITGEWKRNDAIEATIHDDPRLRAEVLQYDEDGYTVAIFIPAEAIGYDSLSEGIELGAALARRFYKGLLREQIDASWPVSKNDGLLDGAHQWGKFVLVD